MAYTVSVALATCDGERFLGELLDSLSGQGCLPYELIVSDDASLDSTAHILDGFQKRSAFSTRIVRNARRLGVVRNFTRAITECRGDWIALADQDDVWRSDKLGKLLPISTDPAVMAIFSDAEVVDESRKSYGYTMWEQIGFDERRQALCSDDRPWDVLFKDPVVTGATLLFRRELLPLILPVPESWMHDAWIAQISASQGQLVAVPTPLIEYRQHNANVIGGRKVPLFGQVRRAGSIGRLGLVERELRRHEELRDRLATFPATTRRDRMLTLCDAKLHHLLRRSRVPSARIRRAPSVFREWLNGDYARFAKDWRNIAADLLMP